MGTGSRGGDSQDFVIEKVGSETVIGLVPRTDSPTRTVPSHPLKTEDDAWGVEEVWRREGEVNLL